MAGDGYLCPICGADMIMRKGTKLPYFWGCSTFEDLHCLGKRTLDGTVFGINSEMPVGISSENESLFDAAISDGMDYDEARDMVLEWERIKDE